MRNQRPWLLLLAGVLMFPLMGTAWAGKPDLNTLSRKMDSLYRAKTSKGRMTMSVTTPNYSRTLVMDVMSRGQNDTLIRIKSPRKERGISTLKRGREMWNYLPKIRKTIRIPPSMMMGSWMGSDFTNDDLVKQSSWEKDYTMGWADASAKPGQLCVAYVPKKSAVVNWSKVMACFSATTLLPQTIVFFDEKKRKVRRLTYSDVRPLGGRNVPTKMTLTPLLKKGHRTVIQYNNMVFDQPLPANTFTLANLRRGR
jgi:outer membrane lipoprotein-sorting protein